MVSRPRRPLTLASPSAIAEPGSATSTTSAWAASPPSRPKPVTSWPAAAQRRANPPPTCPFPITLIRIALLLSDRAPLRHGARYPACHHALCELGEFETADRHATVDNQHVAEQVARLARAEPNCRGGELGRCAAALCRDGLLGELGKGGILSTVGNHHRRFSPTGRKGVDPDAPRRVLHGGHAREAMNPMF